MFSIIYRGNDPNHHTLDTLEQCMAFLLERIAGPDSPELAAANSQSTLLRNDSVSTLKRVTSSSIQGKKKKVNSSYDDTTVTLNVLGIGFHNNEQFTKVVYFTERTVTPFLTVIPRRLGEISLRDFKSLFDRPGVYRFHFKAQDAEYGFVKEEVRHFVISLALHNDVM